MTNTNTTTTPEIPRFDVEQARQEAVNREISHLRADMRTSGLGELACLSCRFLKDSYDNAGRVKLSCSIGKTSPSFPGVKRTFDLENSYGEVSDKVIGVDMDDYDGVPQGCPDIPEVKELLSEAPFAKEISVPLVVSPRVKSA